MHYHVQLCAIHGTQGFLHARQALYPLRHTPTLFSSFVNDLSSEGIYSINNKIVGENPLPQGRVISR